MVKKQTGGNLIYFLHIHDTLKSDCKLFFREEIVLNTYLYKRLDKDADIGYPNVEILKIDEEKCTKYQKMYKAKCHGM